MKKSSVGHLSSNAMKNFKAVVSMSGKKSSQHGSASKTYYAGAEFNTQKNKSGFGSQSNQPYNKNVTIE